MPLARAFAATAILVAIAGWPEEARARIAELVAGRSRLFAIDDGAVVMFDEAGRPVGRCNRFADPPAPERPAGPGIGAPDPEDVLRAGGLPADDFDSTLAEVLLDDAGLKPIARRRLAAPLASIELRALAADPSRDAAWIATSAGLYRANGSGCAPQALGGRDVRLVAANANVVAATTDELVWRFDTVTGGVAGISGLTSLPRAIAVTSDGQVVVADDEGLLAIQPDGAVARVIDRPVDALVACGEANAALADDGVYIWASGGRPARAAPRPPARKLTCGPGPGPRWLAAGVGLWLSSDGDDWADLAGWRGLSIGSAAALAGRIWLVVDGTLLAADASGTTLARPRARLPPLPVTTDRSMLSHLPWPLVSVVVAGQLTSTRTGWSAVVLLTFPLGSRRRARSAAAERARRDAALAAEEGLLSCAPMDDDERDARLRATRQEREALR